MGLVVFWPRGYVLMPLDVCYVSTSCPQWPPNSPSVLFCESFRGQAPQGQNWGTGLSGNLLRAGAVTCKFGTSLKAFNPSTPFPRDWSQINRSKVHLYDILQVKQFALSYQEGLIYWDSDISYTWINHPGNNTSFFPTSSWTGCLHRLFEVRVQPGEHWVLGGVWALQENTFASDASQSQADFQTVCRRWFAEWGETSSYPNLLLFINGWGRKALI